MLTVEDVRVAVAVAVVVVEGRDNIEGARVAVVVAVEGRVNIEGARVVVVVLTVDDAGCFFGTTLGTEEMTDLLVTVSFLAVLVRGAGLVGMIAFFTDANLCLAMLVLVEVEEATVDTAPMRDFAVFGVLGVSRFTRPWKEGRRDFLAVDGAFFAVGSNDLCFIAVSSMDGSFGTADNADPCFTAVDAKLEVLDTIDTGARR